MSDQKKWVCAEAETAAAILAAGSEIGMDLSKLIKVSEFAPPGVVYVLDVAELEKLMTPRPVPQWMQTMMDEALLDWQKTWTPLQNQQQYLTRQRMTAVKVD